MSHTGQPLQPDPDAAADAPDADRRPRGRGGRSTPLTSDDAPAAEAASELRFADAVSNPSALALIGANLIPLIGVLALGWELGAVLILFWAENGVIGVYNVVKMLIVGGWRAIPLTVFFTVHYGGFMAGHLLFLLVIIGGGFRAMSDAPVRDAKIDIEQYGLSLALAVLGLFISHGVSFVRYFLRGRERPDDYKDLMHKPYARIIILHVTIIFGAVLVLATGSSVAVLVLLVVLKTAVDLWAHLREHRKALSRVEPGDGVR